MKMLIGMVIVFQMPTLVLFLAKLRLVTARLLWRHIKYAILASFIVGALLTSSADPWNQAVFAAPMMLLYVVSIGIAWLVGPKRQKGDPRRHRFDDAPTGHRRNGHRSGPEARPARARRAASIAGQVPLKTSKTGDVTIPPRAALIHRARTE